MYWLYSFTYVIQVETLKATIVEFYGEDASTSPDLTRIVNANHFRRVTRLLDDPRTTEKIVHGGERNEQSLWVTSMSFWFPTISS